MYYIPDKNGGVQSELDLLRWGEWMQTAERHVADTLVGNVRISTVFLGIDHNLSGEGPPLLWETMIFNWDKEDDYCERYSSLKAAQEGHEAAVKLVKEANKTATVIWGAATGQTCQTASDEA